MGAPPATSSLADFPTFDSASNMNSYTGGGTGVSNANFVVDQASGITLGLKSHERYNGDWCPATYVDGRGVYHAHAGPGRRPETGHTAWLKFKGTTWSYYYAYDLGENDPALYGIRVRLDFNPATVPAARNTWYTYEIFGHRNGGEDLPGLPSARAADSQSFGWDWWGDFADGEHLNFKGNPAPEGGQPPHHQQQRLRCLCLGH